MNSADSVTTGKPMEPGFHGAPAAGAAARLPFDRLLHGSDRPDEPTTALKSTLQGRRRPTQRIEPHEPEQQSTAVRPADEHDRKTTPYQPLKQDSPESDPPRVRLPDDSDDPREGMVVVCTAGSAVEIASQPVQNSAPCADGSAQSTLSAQDLTGAPQLISPDETSVPEMSSTGIQLALPGEDRDSTSVSDSGNEAADGQTLTAAADAEDVASELANADVTTGEKFDITHYAGSARADAAIRQFASSPTEIADVTAGESQPATRLGDIAAEAHEEETGPNDEQAAPELSSGDASAVPAIDAATSLPYDTSAPVNAGAASSPPTSESARPPHGDSPLALAIAPAARPLPHLLAREEGTGFRPARPVEVDAARFLSRVARAFQVAQQRGGELRLRLSPPELGSLRLELRVLDGVLTARLETETPAARQTLIEQLPALRERLAEQGIRVERFDVDLMQQQGQGARDQQAEWERGKVGEWESVSRRAPTADKLLPDSPSSTLPLSDLSAGLNVIV
jgi:flagellar hook-length control protein FliK